MKTYCLIVLFATVVAMASAARVCVIDTRNCNSNVNVCGRYGQSNLCQKFRNSCFLQSANCAQTTQYRTVRASMCRGIGLNTRRTCSSANNGNGSGNIGIGNGGLVNIGLGNGGLGSGGLVNGGLGSGGLGNLGLGNGGLTNGGLGNNGLANGRLGNRPFVFARQ